MARSPPADVTEFFPPLEEVSVSEGARDAYGRRSWVVGPTRGEGTRLLEALFRRCAGRHKGFFLRLPDTRELVVARFEVDALPVLGDGPARRCAGVVVREIFAP